MYLLLWKSSDLKSSLNITAWILCGMNCSFVIYVAADTGPESDHVTDQREMTFRGVTCMQHTSCSTQLCFLQRTDVRGRQGSEDYMKDSWWWWWIRPLHMIIGPDLHTRGQLWSTESNADIPPQTLQETLKCICSTGQRRKQLLACHIRCAEFYVLWLIPQNRQLGHLGQSWRGSEERLKTEDRNTGGGSMTRNCASQNLISSYVLSIPPRLLFYAVKHKFIQWGYSWCTLFSAPPHTHKRQITKETVFLDGRIYHHGWGHF